MSIETELTGPNHWPVAAYPVENVGTSHKPEFVPAFPSVGHWLSFVVQSLSLTLGVSTPKDQIRDSALIGVLFKALGLSADCPVSPENVTACRDALERHGFYHIPTLTACYDLLAARFDEQPKPETVEFYRIGIEYFWESRK